MNNEQIQRFQKFIELDLLSGCWNWTGCLRNGYGGFRLNKKIWSSHRLSFTHWNGKIKKGLTIDHLCRNKICCNPAHLEAVTQKENTARGTGITVTNSQKTHCKKGHEYVGDNLILSKAGGKVCRICKNQQNLNYHYREKDKLCH